MIMTREEQILSEAKKHYSDSINCHNAFLHGVEWADEHPKNVWHSADEEPEGKDWKILLEDKNGNHWVTSRCSVSVFYGNWQKFTEYDALTRWAYIPELLPKGGEL